MTPHPKHYLAEVPQDLRMRVLDLCIHRQWHDALELLHQNGFTQYEWWEVVWFHDHAPSNLEARSADGSSAFPCDLAGTPVPSTPLSIPPDLNAEPRTGNPEPETLTPNLNAEPRTRNPEPLALTPRCELRGSMVKSSPVKPKRRKPRSKACRLPKDIQANLNTLLAARRPYAEIIRWLSDRGYSGFNKVNLHNWRLTGFQSWLRPENGDVTESVQKVSEGV